MSMPGKQPRVLCPVCQEPIPPDETECRNCGAFVIDEAVVRLSRAFGLDREKALKLFEAGFRHTKQLRDRDPNGILEKGEVGLLFICTNCGGFVAASDPKCPRCAAEFEAEPEPPDAPQPAAAPKTPEAAVKPSVAMPKPAPASPAKLESAPARSPVPVPVPSRPASPIPEQKAVAHTGPAPAIDTAARLAPRGKPATPASARIRGRAESPSRTPGKNARAPAREARNRITAETAGGLALAASTSLLLAGALNQRIVAARLAALRVGFGAYLTVDYLRSARARPPRFDALLLGGGTVLTVSTLLLRGSPIDPNAAVVLPVLGVLPFAGATRSLVRGPHRILLAIASATPIIGQAIATVADPAYAMSLP